MAAATAAKACAHCGGECRRGHEHEAEAVEAAAYHGGEGAAGTMDAVNAVMRSLVHGRGGAARNAEDISIPMEAIMVHGIKGRDPSWTMEKSVALAETIVSSEAHAHPERFESGRVTQEDKRALARAHLKHMYTMAMQLSGEVRLTSTHRKELTCMQTTAVNFLEAPVGLNFPVGKIRCWLCPAVADVAHLSFPTVSFEHFIADTCHDRNRYSPGSDPDLFMELRDMFQSACAEFGA